MKKKKSNILKKTGMAVGAVSMGLFLNGISISHAEEYEEFIKAGTEIMNSIEQEMRIEEARERWQKYREHLTEDEKLDLLGLEIIPVDVDSDFTIVPEKLENISDWKPPEGAYWDEFLERWVSS